MMVVGVPTRCRNGDDIQGIGAAPAGAFVVAYVFCPALQAPNSIVAVMIAPNATAATVTRANSAGAPKPSQATATQPNSAAIARRTVPARTGHSTRPAPWLAK